MSELYCHNQQYCCKICVGINYIESAYIFKSFVFVSFSLIFSFIHICVHTYAYLYSYTYINFFFLRCCLIICICPCYSRFFLSFFLSLSCSRVYSQCDLRSALRLCAMCAAQREQCFSYTLYILDIVHSSSGLNKNFLCKTTRRASLSLSLCMRHAHIILFSQKKTVYIESAIE